MPVEAQEAYKGSMLAKAFFAKSAVSSVTWQTSPLDVSFWEQEAITPVYKVRAEARTKTFNFFFII